MPREKKPQSYYDDIKRKFAEERDLRLGYRPEGTQQFTSELEGVAGQIRRRPVCGRTGSAGTDQRHGGGALHWRRFLSATDFRPPARKRRRDPSASSRRGADVGGTWYWNRYPGVACDVVSLRLPAAAR